jgi:hypothetical protein
LKALLISSIEASTANSRVRGIMAQTLINIRDARRNLSCCHAEAAAMPENEPKKTDMPVFNGQYRPA